MKGINDLRQEREYHLRQLKRFAEQNPSTGAAYDIMAAIKAQDAITRRQLVKGWYADNLAGYWTPLKQSIQYRLQVFKNYTI